MWSLQLPRPDGCRWKFAEMDAWNGSRIYPMTDRGHYHSRQSAHAAPSSCRTRKAPATLFATAQGSAVATSSSRRIRYRVQADMHMPAGRATPTNTLQQKASSYMRLTEHVYGVPDRRPSHEFSQHEQISIDATELTCFFRSSFI